MAVIFPIIRKKLISEMLLRLRRNNMKWSDFAYSRPEFGRFWTAVPEESRRKAKAKKKK